MRTITFQDLKSNLKKDFSSRRVVKISVLGDTSTQLLTTAVKGYGYEAGFNFDIFESGYDQVYRQLMDPSSDVYKFKPDWIIVSCSAQKFTKDFYALPRSEKIVFSDRKLDRITQLYNSISSNGRARLIFFNLAEYEDGVFGNYANKVECSLLYQMRKFNLGLMDLSRRSKDFYVSDISNLQSRLGEAFAHDPRIYAAADMIFSMDFLPAVAKNIIDIIMAASGMAKKCLIVDLDNVLWGGLIGDDGLANIQLGGFGIGKVFTEIQAWIKQLSERGIIIAVCSKNEESIAKEPFEKHPDMVLRLDDIAVFTANWENKADNVAIIQRTLNIGFDSMVFIDDSPFERNMVRSRYPDITIPDLPEDPAGYLRYLRGLDLFEACSYTEEDFERTDRYRQEAGRRIAEKAFSGEDDFLSSLKMKAATERFESFNAPRIAQLTQRSNQFNLRTIRYSEEDIGKMIGDENCLGLSFSLKDEYGDYGLVSAVVLRKKGAALFIDTWVMSCRVIKRGLEEYILNNIVERAQQIGVNSLEGEYIQTSKNALVKDLYQDLGFAKMRDTWVLDISGYKPKKTHITLLKEGH